MNYINNLENNIREVCSDCGHKGKTRICGINKARVYVYGITVKIRLS
ncbi:hypothetical protein CDLVIII_4521 [Clostridium sp. DL-VIII]|nr:hypothetical protein [Clostridium sp. DL-VIII]EHJ01029.1 hypothetical protein CDLVIII_4521 [Clostridium sp. DL-VIII]